MARADSAHNRSAAARGVLVVLGARFPIVGRVVISSLLFVILVVGIVLVPKTMTGPSQVQRPNLGRGVDARAHALGWRRRRAQRAGL